MAGFDAGRSVEALDYDFTTSVGSDGEPLKGKGTIPEPTDEDINRLLRRVQEVGSEVGIDFSDTDDTPAAVAKKLDEAGDDVLGQMMGDITEVIAEFCKGHPSHEEIDALPFRIRMAFIGWLLGQFTDPTKFGVGTTPSPGARPLAASST